MKTWIPTLYKNVKFVKNWHEVVFARFRLTNKPLRKIKFRNGLTFTIPTNEVGITREIILDKDYNPKGFEFSKDDVVVDIGGHVGIFSIYASKQVKKVYTFEPFIDNFNMLVENINQNKIKNIIAINEAMADKAGEQTLHLSKVGTGSHSLLNELDEGGREVKIKVISANGFFDKLDKVDFLKIDCEGSEYKILPNISDKNFSKIKKISMEVHNIDDKHNVDFIKGLLISKGFSVRAIPKGDKWNYLYALRRN